jgi:hypothetical protein
MAVGVGLFLLWSVVGILLFPDHTKAAVAVGAVLLALFIAWGRTPLARLKSPEAGIPALTIRQHLKRTNAYFQRIMVPVTAAWVAVVTLFVTDISKIEQQTLAVGGCLTLFLIAWLFVRNKLRCPRCGSDFRKERIAKLGRFSFDTRAAADLWDACPHCGVSFNDLWP